MRLKDKVIIVTGSTTGIGEAIARQVVAEGGQVIVAGLERELGEAVVRDLGKSAALCCNDLARPESARELVSKAIEAFGRIDGIANNAATTQRATIDNVTPDVFDRIFAINVRAPMLLVQAALAELKKNRGSVLNIGSCNAYCGEPNLLPYSMSKGALMTLTRNLSDQLCYDGVRVNQMNLGWVLTENEKRVQTQVNRMPADWYMHPPKAFAPSGSLILPEEVARLACYWLSDESRPVSGTVMEFDQYPIIGRNPPKGPELLG